jgi:cbb3-type cytochrome oxidase subunit 3
MDPVTAFRIGATLAMFVIFGVIVWWAYGGSRSHRFERAAHSVLSDDDTPRTEGEAK